MRYLKELMKKKRMTRSDLCRESDLPDSTVRDILNGKARIDHCEAGTLFDIATALDTTVEEILGHYWEERLGINTPNQPFCDDCSVLRNEPALNFYYAVDTALHALKNYGVEDFIQFVRNRECAEHYYNLGQYGAALFLTGLVDYLERHMGHKSHPAFAGHRSERLDTPMFPLRLMNIDFTGVEYEACKKEIMNHAIPELARFNIFMTREDLGLN